MTLLASSDISLSPATGLHCTATQTYLQTIWLVVAIALSEPEFIHFPVPSCRVSGTLRPRERNSKTSLTFYEHLPPELSIAQCWSFTFPHIIIIVSSRFCESASLQRLPVFDRRSPGSATASTALTLRTLCLAQSSVWLSTHFYTLATCKAPS